jgi:predicted nucleotidyltransferase
MNEKIKEIIHETLKDYTIDKIILFGSRARGDNNEDSDYDVLVSLKENLSRDDRNKLTHKILLNLAKIYVPADVIIRSCDYVEMAKYEIGNVIHYAMEEGFVL